jgi:3-oxoacyl-[acyl-carrier protein] reductase
MDLALGGVRALVTAASQGLGRACAASLAAEGAAVVVSSRSPERLADAAAETGAQGWVAADLRQAQDVDALIASTVDKLGGLDVLVSNCGPPPTGSFEESGDQEWDIAHELVLMSAVRLARAALPHLAASGRGRIVHLTGYGVREPLGQLVISEATRASVTVMAKVLADEYGPHGITVNNIAPGPILTDRLWHLQRRQADSAGVDLEEQLRRSSEQIPVRRVGRPEEIGALCAFLCSANAGFLTGQTIVVDGGINRAV